MLEEAGAKVPEDFKIDAAAARAVCRNLQERRAAPSSPSSSMARGSRSAAPPAPPAQRGTLAAKDATTFRGIGMGGVSVVFKVEGDKVTGFTLIATPGQSHRLHARGGEVMMRPLPHRVDVCGCRRVQRRALGAALAGVPRRERRRRRRRQADGREVERGDRRERRVEDAGPRRRRVEPDRLGRPRVRLDRDQQRSRTRASGPASTATSSP